MKATPLLALLGAVLFATAPAQPAQPQIPDTPLRPLYADADPVCRPEDLRKLVLPNTTIDAVEIDSTDGFCRVTATVSHPPANDRAKAFIALLPFGYVTPVT